MTNERLCERCGQEQAVPDHDPEAHLLCTADVSPPWLCSLHPFEAAPSTDEEEARKGHECDAWCVFQSWVSEIRGGASNTDDLGLRSAFDAIAAEAREPLEERIRAADQRALFWENATAASVVTLEQERVERRAAEERIRELEARAQVAESNQDLLASAFDADGPFDRLQVDNERLREALRWAYDQFPPEMHGAVHPVLDRTLATPPSSTEGTDEPTFDRLSMHRSEDWGTKEVEG